MRTRRVAWLCGMGLTLGLSACAVVFGFEPLSDSDGDAGREPQLDARTVEDAGPVDAGGDAARPGPCLPLPLPERPTETPTTNGDYSFAISTFRLRVGDTNEGTSGLDLDCQNTTSIDNSTCRASGAGELAKQLLVDRAGGIDNGAITLFKAIKLQNNLDVAAGLPRLSQAGVIGGVISLVEAATLDVPDAALLSDNGMSVLFQPARGLFVNGTCSTWHAPDAGADAGDDAGPATRPLSKSDVWCVDRDYFGPPVSSAAAWINGGVVVAKLDQIFVPVALDEDLESVSYIRIESAILTATVGRLEDGTLALQRGTIARRWKVADLVKQFAASVGVDAGNTSCELLPEVEAFMRGSLCPGRDIRSSFDVDPNEACDSVSFGIDFEAYQVLDRGEDRAYPSRLAACLDGGAAPDSGFFFDCDQ